MVTLLKANGEKEQFNEGKLLHSIQRAGIPLELQEEVVAHVKSRLHENISSREVYRHITEFLGKSKEPYTLSRYSLKQAIMMLGPTGYPFEDFFADILEEQGYSTKTRQVIRGRCISHEIDVIARKGNKTSMVEAKFHNNPGTRTEVHVAMYTKSRFDDVKERYQFNDAWIVTNTKATIDAVTFAQCNNMQVISWSYPEKGSLRDMIEESHLFPVTSLISLTPGQKTKLLQNHITLCKAICKDNYLLDILQLDIKQKRKVLDEVNFLCHRDMTRLPVPEVPMQAVV